MKVLIVTALVLTAFGCSKNSGPGPKGPGGGDSLLAKEIWVAKNSSGVTVDSVVTFCTYDGNRNLNGVEQTTISSMGAYSTTTVLTYQLILSNNLPSSLSGSVAQTVKDGVLTQSASTQLNTTFTASGGHITSYVQVAKTTGSVPIPVTPQTGNDSAVLAYDATGNVSAFNLFQKPTGGTTYVPLSQQTFTYSGANLSQSVNKLFVGGVFLDTYTSTYTYNTKNSPFPAYSLGSALFVGSVNDVTEYDQTETGANPGQINTAYSSVYNSVGQPVTSTATLTVTPSDPGGPATVRIAYFYQ